MITISKGGEKRQREDLCFWVKDVVGAIYHFPLKHGSCYSGSSVIQLIFIKA